MWQEDFSFSSWISDIECLLSENALRSLLEALTSPPYAPMQHLEREQALAKQFAEILHFTLSFDELKVRQINYSPQTLTFTVLKDQYVHWAALLKHTSPLSPHRWQIQPFKMTSATTGGLSVGTGWTTSRWDLTYVIRWCMLHTWSNLESKEQHHFLSLIINDLNGGVSFLWTTQTHVSLNISFSVWALQIGAGTSFIIMLCCINDLNWIGGVVFWHAAGSRERGEQWDGQSDVSVLCWGNTHAEDSE